MELHSTRLLGSTLSLSSLIARARASDRTVVVSAYFDKAFLCEIVEAALARRSATAEVVLHQSAGRQLEEQLRVLKEVERSAGSRKTRLRLALVDGMPLFHSKMFAFRRGPSWTVFLGSANATTAALGAPTGPVRPRNEEILLEIKGREVDASIRRYIDEVSKLAINFDEVTPTAQTSLFQWYRNATCYYRPNINVGLRFDLRLPDLLRQQLTRNQLDERFPELTEERGAVTYPLWRDTADESSASRTVITPIGIQTCYGWWVPTPYVRQFDGRLRRRQSGKAKAVAVEARKRFLAIRSGATKEKIKRVMARLTRVAAGIKIDYPEPNDRIEKRLDAFLEGARDKLGNPTWIQRVASGYASAPVPEIWNDPLAVDSFERSFYEYLEYVGARPGAKTWVWKVLQRACAFNAGDGWLPIRRHVRERVEKGWSGDAWVTAKGRLTRP